MSGPPGGRLGLASDGPGSPGLFSKAEWQSLTDDAARGLLDAETPPPRPRSPLGSAAWQPQPPRSPLRPGGSSSATRSSTDESFLLAIRREVDAAEERLRTSLVRRDEHFREAITTEFEDKIRKLEAWRNVTENQLATLTGGLHGVKSEVEALTGRVGLCDVRIRESHRKCEESRSQLRLERGSPPMKGGAPLSNSAGEELRELNARVQQCQTLVNSLEETHGRRLDMAEAQVEFLAEEHARRTRVGAAVPDQAQTPKKSREMEGHLAALDEQLGTRMSQLESPGRESIAATYATISSTADTAKREQDPAHEAGAFGTKSGEQPSEVGPLDRKLGALEEKLAGKNTTSRSVGGLRGTTSTNSSGMASEQAQPNMGSKLASNQGIYAEVGELCRLVAEQGHDLRQVQLQLRAQQTSLDGLRADGGSLTDMPAADVHPPGDGTFSSGISDPSSLVQEVSALRERIESAHAAIRSLTPKLLAAAGDEKPFLEAVHGLQAACAAPQGQGRGHGSGSPKEEEAPRAAQPPRPTELLKSKAKITASRPQRCWPWLRR